VIVNIDGDMQFDPEDIKLVAGPVIEGRTDFVTATRYKRYLDYNLKVGELKIGEINCYLG